MISISEIIYNITKFYSPFQTVNRLLASNKESERVINISIWLIILGGNSKASRVEIMGV